MRVTVNTRMRAGLFGALATGSALALAAAPLPPVHNEGGVAYLSGGIGQGEAQAIEGSERNWPLTLEFAQRDRNHGDFVANVAVVVRDAHGNTSLHATSDGPFLLARLAPGRYKVDATLDGKTLHEKVAVHSGAPTKAIFVWPAGTDHDNS